MTTSNPHRPEEEISSEERRIIEERMATYERDKKDAMDAKQALAAIRRSLKHPAPR